MCLILLACLASLASASPLALGGRQCTWGPSYWCANIPQASECGAVKHCVKAVWEKETVPQDDDEVCTICKDMVGEARDTLLSNETQEELKEVFDGSCDLIPIKLVAKECRTVMDEFVPELVETLASEMNPDTVCTVAGLCNSARIDRLLEERRQQMQMGGDCQLCKTGAAKTKKQIQDASPEQVEDKMLELCGYLGSFSDGCMMAVLDQSASIYTSLTTTDWENEICDLSGLCSQAFENVPATSVSEGEDIQCEFCEKVIQHWVDVYASNASLAEFKEMLDGICEKLDKRNADHCKHVVDDYYIPAFEFLKNEINPHTICSLAGLCGNEVETEVSVITEQQQNQVALIPAYSTQEVLDSSSCDMCQLVMTEVFTVLKDPSDQEMVKNVLESVCYRLPDSWERSCEDFVESYTDMILNFIANDLNPNQVCEAMNLCGDNLLVEEIQPLEIQQTVGDETCVLCEYVVTTLDKMVTDKANEQEIKDALEKLCNMLPSSISKQCDSFVETYTDLIIDLLTKDVSPEMICTNLGLCKKDMVRPMEVVEVETIRVGGDRVGGAYCTLCELVINNLDSQLEDKSNEDEIKAALDVLCYGLSTPVHKECLKLVSQYTDELVEMIVKDYSPNVICADLGLCVDHEISSNSISEVFETVQVEAQVEDEVGCVICEFAINVIDERLGDESTVDMIEREVQFVCSYLPGHLDEKCEDLVDQYGQKLIDALIKDEMDPKQVCTDVVPACTPSHPGCVWGPEMWCASPFHASVCGATSMCQAFWRAGEN